MSLQLTVGLNDVDISNMLGRKCCFEQSPSPFMLGKTKSLACEICVVDEDEEAEAGGKWL